MAPIDMMRTLDGGKATVLAAPTEAERDGLRRLLRRASYQVLEAHDGHAAVVDAVAERPDLILKIGVPEALLRKPGPLTDSEWLEMQRHPIVGAAIVAPLRLGRLVAPIVRAHHERWDGAGYPDGLRRDQIPIGARIVTVVDAFDAMVHDRPYRPGRAWDALEELSRFRGTQFDPSLVDLFTARARHRASDPQPTPCL